MKYLLWYLIPLQRRLQKEIIMRLLLATFCLVLLLFSTIASAKIVFSLRDVSIHEDVNGVYVMDDNGNNITLLTKNTFTTSRWSPDGRQIVFSGPSKEKDW